MKVLLIEDNLILSRNTTKMLIKDDIFTDLSIDGLDGYKKAMSKYYDIIILDINLPSMDGFLICKKLREAGKECGIIMLTSLSGVDNIVDGLNSGADDYLTKPFEYKELLSRINVIMRRKMKNLVISTLKIQDLELDLEKYEVFRDGSRICLSRIEFKLLKTLAENRGKVLSRRELFELIWGESNSDFIFSRTLDVHIRNLRKKLGENVIETRKGIGFIIN